MRSIYVISVVTENAMRVLQRLAGIFARHRLNIEQLNVFETSNMGASLVNIVVNSDEKTIARVINQSEKIFEVSEVKISNQIRLNQENHPSIAA